MEQGLSYHLPRHYKSWVDFWTDCQPVKAKYLHIADDHSDLPLTDKHDAHWVPRFHVRYEWSYIEQMANKEIEEALS